MDISQFMQAVESFPEAELRITQGRAGMTLTFSCRPFMHSSCPKQVMQSVISGADLTSDPSIATAYALLRLQNYIESSTARSKLRAQRSNV